MNEIEIKILESALVLLFYVIVIFITKNVINNALKNAQLQRARRKMIIKAVQLLSTIAFMIILAGVWGLEQDEIAVFATSVITALGIAFFAQWSLLANITSSIILFFNHPLKIGDKIKILDRDYPFEGEITELTYFYVHLRSDAGELLTVPNAIFLQKSVAILPVTEKI
ncbi:MAG: mechanosensitive ion channel domain-containing protein [Bacteroidota bacterium]|jgi:small-conductance mechanosensitive channel